MQKRFWSCIILIFHDWYCYCYLSEPNAIPAKREDYAYPAFSIWGGLGVLSVFQNIRTYFQGIKPAVITVILCILLVPGIMAWQNWDDHDRSGRYTVRDIAKNYLDSCDENAILFTNGDNDTFPLWYIQDVEGYRTDVRVVNLMLLNADWYIDQMKKKSYKSEALPVSLPFDKYQEDVNNIVYVFEDTVAYLLSDLIEGIKRGDKFYIEDFPAEGITILPTNKFILPTDINLLISNRTVSPENVHLIESPMMWEYKRSYLLKSGLIQMDILANNNWSRPVYFIAGGDEGASGLEDYFQLEGLASRLVPIRTPGKDVFFEPGRVESGILYDNLMNKFKWGRMNEKDVYLDHFNIRTFSVIKFRKSFIRLAETLIEQGKKREAEQVLDRCMELAPNHKIPYDHYISGISYVDNDNNKIRIAGIIEMYYKCGAIDKANSIIKEYAAILLQDLEYYNSLNNKFKRRFESEAYQSQSFYNSMSELAEKYMQERHYLK